MRFTCVSSRINRGDSSQDAGLSRHMKRVGGGVGAVVLGF